jgi:ABC-type transport system substrate-binding protein
MRVNQILFFLVLSLLLTLGCRKEVKRNYIVIGSTIDIDSFNPYLSTSLFTQDILDRVYLRLAVEHEDYRTFTPLLAKRWEWSKDSLQITFIFAMMYIGLMVLRRPHTMLNIVLKQPLLPNSHG